MHKKTNPPSKPPTKVLKSELGPTVFSQDSPPSDEFALLLPSHIYGYSMQDKRWSKLGRQYLTGILFAEVK
jgi:hypothetical protein